MRPVVQGYIDPPVPEGTEASVFAVFDANKKLQYVGFSRDLRNSLRTVFGRRPDKVFYHKCALGTPPLPSPPPRPCPHVSCAGQPALACPPPVVAQVLAVASLHSCGRGRGDRPGLVRLVAPEAATARSALLLW